MGAISQSVLLVRATNIQIATKLLSRHIYKRGHMFYSHMHLVINGVVRRCGLTQTTIFS